MKSVHAGVPTLMITAYVLKSACQDNVLWQPCVDQCAVEVNWFISCNTLIAELYTV